jgi:ribosomal protein S18 acetylase RimI-like enzyme
MTPSFQLCRGSTTDRASLLHFLISAYEELFPETLSFSHLAGTVENILHHQTPIWFVTHPDNAREKLGCLWVGKAIDQSSGDRHSHILLIYVSPAYRRQGIGTILLQQAETWARLQGDRYIGLQVFTHNQPALNLYEKMGYAPRSLLMIRSIEQLPIEADRRGVT